jgi:hypothetical protein
VTDHQCKFSAEEMWDAIAGHLAERVVARLVDISVERQDADTLIPAKEASKHGAGHRKVLAAVARGELAGYRVGRAHAVKLGELRAWVQRHRVATKQPDAAVRRRDPLDAAIAAGRLRVVGRAGR